VRREQNRDPCAPEDSTVSIFFGGRYTASGFGPRMTWKEKFIRCLTSIDHNQAPLIVMDPIVARLFIDLGFDTKEKLSGTILRISTSLDPEHFREPTLLAC
jgi:hypothetical protein